MTLIKSIKTTVYEQIGGEVVVRLLVERFYEHMDESEFETIRTLHQDMHRARENLFLFLSGWLGGPPLFTDKYGHPRLRQRHLPFKIGIVERDQWLKCMTLALDDININPDLKTKLQANFLHTADFMRNQDE